MCHCIAIIIIIIIIIIKCVIALLYVQSLLHYCRILAN